ncbi:MAG: DUF308 domain-containing protein [archaeon]|jgi:hypothetical protein
MAKKKSKPAKRKFAAKKAPVLIEDTKGFFERFKDIIPQQKKETVRVKTFIVEKPVYVSAPQERVYHPPQKYVMDEADQKRFDSRQSRYSKRNQKKQDEVPQEEMDEPQIGEEGSEEFANEAPVGDDFDENGEQEVTDEEGAVQEEGESAELPASTHVRSRGMVKNIWWRKALFWAILVWLIILAISMGMQAIKLIEVDLTRQWWMLLAGLIVIMLVYFKFFEGKI